MLVFFFCAQKTKILLFIHLIMSSSAGMRLWYIVRIVLYNCIHTNLQIPPYVRSVLMRFRITHPLHSATKHIRRHRRRCCVHECEYYSQYCDAVHEREYGTKTYRNIFLSYFNNFFLYMYSRVQLSSPPYFRECLFQFGGFLVTVAMAHWEHTRTYVIHYIYIHIFISIFSLLCRDDDPLLVVAMADAAYCTPCRAVCVCSAYNRALPMFVLQHWI